MAVSVSTVTKGRSNDVWGTRQIGLYRVTLDSSYADNGEDFDPGAYGFQGNVQAVFISPRWTQAASDAADTFHYDHTNKRIVAYNGGTEVTAAVDLSGVVLDIIVVGE